MHTKVHIEDDKIKQLLAFYDRKNKLLLQEVAKLKRALQQLRHENDILKRNITRLQTHE